MSKLLKLKRIKTGLKDSITNVTKDLDDFLVTASMAERNGKKDTIKSTLARIEKINNELYDLYEDDETVTEEIDKDLSYEERINIIIASLSSVGARSVPNTQNSETSQTNIASF